jgi:hypothetical protein
VNSRERRGADSENARTECGGAKATKPSTVKENAGVAVAGEGRYGGRCEL